MGFLAEGRALTWEEVKEHEVAKYIREHGVLQFINLWKRCEAIQSEEFTWGDEVEFLIVSMDAKAKDSYLALRGAEIITSLNEDKMEAISRGESPPANWIPEYGQFMVEATPSAPYSRSTIAAVEANMRVRRLLVAEKLHANERVMLLTAFPRMGGAINLWDSADPHPFTDPPFPPGGPISQSLYTSDRAINPHERFQTLTANIRKRRGEKVSICVPLFQDKETNKAKLGHATHGTCECVSEIVHMDSMAFGMGCACLQVTFQGGNVSRARYLTDQLAVICPVMLAITAAAPVLKGLLADTDVRWHIISGAVDDRTRLERFGGDCKKIVRDGDTHHLVMDCDRAPIAKSRYASVSCFISDSPRLVDTLHNDIPLEMHGPALRMMREHGFDDRMSRHVAHLFIREPLVTYDNRIQINDETDTDHWESIQSTNWQSVRFKPPPPGSTIGWRVELRVMELQITEFSNAAFAVFSSLLAQAIMHYDMNLYIPISKVDQDFDAALKRNAINDHKFFFRAQVVPPLSPHFATLYDWEGAEDTGDAVTSMSGNELFNGKPGGFRGFVTIVETYVDTVLKPSELDREIVGRYLQFVSKRASGELVTVATWIRRFVDTHPQYKHDSVVNPVVAHDLLEAMDAITKGERHEPSLHGDLLQPST